MELWKWVLVVVAIFSSQCYRTANAAPRWHLVERLPGQPVVGFKQYAGYVTVDQKAGRALFYYFVEADNKNRSSSELPITLWLNGGPGCSSIGGGAFEELGPFRPSSDARGLAVNEKSWNKASNIIFLESPAGVGWSYSNTSSDYKSFGDAKTANDALTFFLEWFKLFPEYKRNELYVTGESYAGHYVPQLAALLASYRGSDGFKFNIKGIAIGNPLLRLDVDTGATYTYLWSHGIISDIVYDAVQSDCNFQDYDMTADSHNVTKLCETSLKQANDQIGDYINNYDVILDVCNPELVQQELRLREKVARISNGVDICITSERTFYFNLPEVQKALHANVTGLPYRWSMCSSVLDYQLNDARTDMVPVLKDLYTKGLRIWIFSGDQDSVVPFIGTRTIISELAQDLNLNTSVPYTAWYYKGQVAGWTTTFGKDVTFATVRGAAHMVPYTQPARSLLLFQSFLSGKRLPTQNNA